MIPNDIDNQYNNGSQPDFFDLSLCSEGLACNFIFTIEDFNKQMTSGMESEEYTEPIFGEHLKEAKEILKGIVKRK